MTHAHVALEKSTSAVAGDKRVDAWQIVAGIGRGEGVRCWLLAQ